MLRLLGLLPVREPGAVDDGVGPHDGHPLVHERRPGYCRATRGTARVAAVADRCRFPLVYLSMDRVFGQDRERTDSYRPPVACVAGVLGTLVGADLLH